MILRLGKLQLTGKMGQARWVALEEHAAPVICLCNFPVVPRTGAWLLGKQETSVSGQPDPGLRVSVLSMTQNSGEPLT